MVSETLLRATLKASAPFNLLAAAMLAWPDGPGRLVDMPTNVHPFFNLLLAALVGVFGVVYAWMAVQPQVDRPLLAVAAIGKVVVFVISASCLAAGQLPLAMMAPALVDLSMGLVFAGWLVGATRLVRRP